MARPSSYPAELRKRAVRMVAEVRGDYPNESAALRAVAQKLGIGSAETLRNWARRDEVDSGQRPGTTTLEEIPEEQLAFFTLEDDGRVLLSCGVVA